MNIIELCVLAVGLSMDAFAVAICKGLAMKKITLKKCFIVGTYFGVFQAAMPIIGYFLGSAFSEKISIIDHWIAFVLLFLIGISMIKEALSSEEEAEVKEDAELGFKNMCILAIATSIDALAVGVTFAFLKVSIIPAVSFIGITTLILSMIGVKIGNIFGTKYKSKAEICGGIILICMGIKILLEHLGFLG